MRTFLLAILLGFVLVGTTNDSQAEPGKAESKKPSASARQVEPEVADLTGYYTCKGQEANGKNYTGVVVLIKRNEVYTIQWVVGGGSNFSGIAIRQGNILAASWAIPNQSGAIVRGVNLYRVESTASGPRLIGRWASIPGPGVQQQETLTFLKGLEVEEKTEEK